MGLRLLRNGKSGQFPERRPALTWRTTLCLALALSLAGCAVAPEVEPEKPGIFKFDWPREKIRATFEYGTLKLFDQNPVCAAKVSIENYGDRTYTLLYFKVSVLSKSKELIGTDRFLLPGSIAPGSRVEIPADHSRQLDPVVATRRFSECPKNMDSAEIKLEAS